jgi:hypothetical protein
LSRARYLHAMRHEQAAALCAIVGEARHCVSSFVVNLQQQLRLDAERVAQARARAC